MPFYEQTVLLRHNLTQQQAVDLIDECVKAIVEGGGRLVEETEYWGLRNLAYRIRNSRKAHYLFLRIEAPHEAVQEMERRMRQSKDNILRMLTVRVDAHEEGQTVIMRAKARLDTRRKRVREEEEEEEGGRRSRNAPPREPTATSVERPHPSDADKGGGRNAASGAASVGAGAAPAVAVASPAGNAAPGGKGDHS